MTRKAIIAAVNAEIERLEQVRALLFQSHSERFTLDAASKPRKKAPTAAKHSGKLPAGKRRLKDSVGGR